MRIQIADEPREILTVEHVISDLRELDPKMLCYKRSFSWVGGQGKMVIEIGNVDVKNVPVIGD